MMASKLQGLLGPLFATAILFWILSVFERPCLGQMDAPVSIELTDVTRDSGVEFIHHSGQGGRGYLVEAMTGGLALFDYDQDGLTDIFFCNGAPFRGATNPSPLRHALYRNLGNMKFQDVTVQSGLDFQGYGLGVTIADYDNDGDQDVFITTFGKNALYQNNGNKTFTEVTQLAGLLGKNQVGAGACFVDVDRDGWLDLFVASYVDFTYENHVPVEAKGIFFMLGPQYYPYLPDSLYRNRGDGTFEDVSVASGIGTTLGPGMGVVAADFDDDGDSDIFVAQDGSPNLLYQNDGQGKFEEGGLFAGLAGNFEGKINGSMGVDCGDLDNDGKLDLFVTNYQSEMPVYYRNLGGGLFEDATRKSKIPSSLFAHVNWGTGIVDFDNDGDRDIFIANGHFDRVEVVDDRTSLKVANTLLVNDGKGRFTDVSKSAGSGMSIVESSRGAAFDDLDQDGDIDVVVLNSNAAASILRNDSKPKGNWIEVSLTGSTSNRDAVGSRVWVHAGGQVQVAEALGGRGYQSYYGRRLHFGLGVTTKVDKIVVRWPNGKMQELEGTEINQVIALMEGK